LKTKWGYMAGILALLAIVPLLGASSSQVTAQEGDHKVYLPIISTLRKELLDDFQDLDPAWDLVFIKDPVDGFFEHLLDRGIYAAHIRDNAALMVSSPGWRTYGDDYSIEVDARFASDWTIGHRLKSLNSMGIVFDANDDWSEYYAFLLQDGGAQHNYALVKVKDTKFSYIYGWRGGPNFMDNWDGTNHIRLRRQGDLIDLYCNGKILPGSNDLVAPPMGQRPQIGLMVASYEFSDGEMEFDNFEMTLNLP